MQLVKGTLKLQSANHTTANTGNPSAHHLLPPTRPASFPEGMAPRETAPGNKPPCRLRPSSPLHPPTRPSSPVTSGNMHTQMISAGSLRCHRTGSTYVSVSRGDDVNWRRGRASWKGCRASRDQSAQPWSEGLLGAAGMDAQPNSLTLATADRPIDLSQFIIIHRRCQLLRARVCPEKPLYTLRRDRPSASFRINAPGARLPFAPLPSWRRKVGGDRQGG